MYAPLINGKATTKTVMWYPSHERCRVSNVESQVFTPYSFSSTIRMQTPDLCTTRPICLTSCPLITYVMFAYNHTFVLAEIGSSIPLKRYKADLHEYHTKTMTEKNSELNTKYFKNNNGSTFYITLCLQKGNEFLTEENITRKVDSLETSRTVESDGETKLGSEIELEDIMDGSNDITDKGSATRVLLLGGPGTGKTTISQTLSYRWGIRELWDEKYDFVFHLTCRKLKEDYKKETNILQLLMKHHASKKFQMQNEEKLHQHIKAYGDRVLVIVDGLDELEGWDEVFREHNKKRRAKVTIRENKSVPELIYNLVLGNTEEKIEVLVTSRPIESITQSRFSRALYALGFNEDAIDECSFALCQSKGKDHGELMKIIKEERPNLYYLCVVPLNCVLLCSRLINNRNSIRSLTDLSLSIVTTCIHSREDLTDSDEYKFTPEQKQLLCSLAQLAFQQFLLYNLIFNNTILDEHKIDSNVPTVKNMMEIHVSHSSEESDNVKASFIHLSIQEFLSALHVCLNWKEDDVKKVTTVDPESMRLDNVQLYTAGLLGDTVNGHKFLQALDKRSGDKMQLYQEQAMEYVTSMHTSGEKLSSLTKLQMIRCAIEGRMPEMIEVVAKAVVVTEHMSEDTTDKVNMLELRQIAGGLLPHHLASIRYFIQESGQVDGLL